MSVTQIAVPYQVFTDTDGTPLNNGYLYIGEANQNPELKPITVYWDAENTAPAPQPIRTSGGFPVRMGTPAVLYTNKAFSITVKNKKQKLVVYAPVGLGNNSLGSQQFTGDGTTVNFATAFPASYSSSADIHISGVYQNKTSYSFVGSQITFSEAPPLNSIIEVNY